MSQSHEKESLLIMTTEPSQEEPQNLEDDKITIMTDRSSNKTIDQEPMIRRHFAPTIAIQVKKKAI